MDGALEHEPVARLKQRIAAAEQHVSVSVQYFDSFDIPFVEQTLGDGCDRGLVARGQCGRKRGAGDFGEAAGACFEVGFQLLRHGGIGELIDVGGIDPVLVVGQAAQYQRQDRPDRQCKQQVLGF